MKKMRSSIVLAAVCVFSACWSQYHGVEPISPMPPSGLVSEGYFGTPMGTYMASGLGGLAMTGGGGAKLTTVDLQPTFSWKCVDTENTKYDIIVYTGIARPPGGRLVYYIPGVEIYYRDGLEGCSHRIEQLLLPSTTYVWGVRTRSGTNVGPWSTYDSQRGLMGLIPNTPGSSAPDQWWAFKTGDGKTN